MSQQMLANWALLTDACGAAKLDRWSNAQVSIENPADAIAVANIRN